MTDFPNDYDFRHFYNQIRAETARVLADKNIRELRVNPPREPAADLRQAASQLHQMFVALCHEGFTEPQALQIVAAILKAGNSAT